MLCFPMNPPKHLCGYVQALAQVLLLFSSGTAISGYLWIHRRVQSTVVESHWLDTNPSSATVVVQPWPWPASHITSYDHGFLVSLAVRWGGILCPPCEMSRLEALILGEWLALAWVPMMGAMDYSDFLHCCPWLPEAQTWLYHFLLFVESIQPPGFCTESLNLNLGAQNP